MTRLTLHLAGKAGLKWCNEQVSLHHYLHSPVDPRCSPVAYHIRYGDEPTGCLIFGRPESTKCNGWYGSVSDVATGACRITRWQVLNLARVWLHPDLQYGGRHYVKNAASWCVSQSLRRVVFDYLMERAVVWMEEPYEIREVLSYCDTRVHTGALYRACNFRLERANDRGIETYVRPVRHLTHTERTAIGKRSMESERSRRLRAERAVQGYRQHVLFEEAL